MSDDLVKRIREMIGVGLQGYHDPQICAELGRAADEIERLRAQLKIAMKALEEINRKYEQTSALETEK